MNVLFVTGHPAQVHNFRNVRAKLIADGHRVFWLTTPKDIACQLLDTYSIPYETLIKPGKGVWSKAKAMLVNVRKVIQVIRKNKIGLVVTRTDPYAAVAGKLCGVPNIMVDDTEHAAQNKMVQVFASMGACNVEPQCFWFQPTKASKIHWSGNIEMYYLHPREFTPTAPYELLGIPTGTRYALIRFVKWDAWHDVKLIGGFSIEQKIDLVKRLSKHLKVFITSETELPEELEPYRIHVPIERMHDVQAFADLFIGESATMASESVVLGTPAIYVDEIGRGYTDEEARAELLWMYRPMDCKVVDEKVYREKLSVKTCMQPEEPYKDANGMEPWWIRGGVEEAIEQAEYITSPEYDREAYAKRHKEWMSGKVDPTAFLTWFVENYPESEKLWREKREEIEGRFRK